MTYPGIKKIGHVERFRFSCHPRSSDILLFAFDHPGIDPHTACTLFKKHFSHSSLEEFRITYDGIDSDNSTPPVIIEALFSDRIEYNSILKNALLVSLKLKQKHQVTAGRDEDDNDSLGFPGVRVYQTAPKNPQYMVYAISSSLPLDSPSRIRDVVSSAVIKRITSCFSITDDEASKYLVDVLVDSCISQQTNNPLPLLQDNDNVCFIVNIPTSLASSWKHVAQHNLFIHNAFYTLSRWPSKYYFYCHHCRSLDYHNTADCPNGDDSTNGSL